MAKRSGHKGNMSVSFQRSHLLLVLPWEWRDCSPHSFSAVFPYRFSPHIGTHGHLAVEENAMQHGPIHFHLKKSHVDDVLLLTVTEDQGLSLYVYDVWKIENVILYNVICCKLPINLLFVFRKMARDLNVYSMISEDLWDNFLASCTLQSARKLSGGSKELTQ